MFPQLKHLKPATIFTQVLLLTTKVQMAYVNHLILKIRCLIVQMGTSTDFSLASNVIDFGIRAYLIEKNSVGTGNLKQIFPDVNSTTGGGNPPYEYTATSNINYREPGKPSRLYAFPEVVDVMIRILTTEGASAISAFEEGLIPTPGGLTAENYWWELAEKNSEVYIRRIRIFGSGI
jgi:hypothetical protein